MPSRFDRRGILLAQAAAREIQADGHNHREDMSPNIVTKPELSTTEVTAGSGCRPVTSSAVVSDPSNFSIEKTGSDFNVLPVVAIKA